MDAITKPIRKSWDDVNFRTLKALSERVLLEWIVVTDEVAHPWQCAAAGIVQISCNLSHDFAISLTTDLGDICRSAFKAEHEEHMKADKAPQRPNLSREEIRCSYHMKVQSDE